VTYDESPRQRIAWVRTCFSSKLIQKVRIDHSEKATDWMNKGVYDVGDVGRGRDVFDGIYFRWVFTSRCGPTPAISILYGAFCIVNWIWLLWQEKIPLKGHWANAFGVRNAACYCFDENFLSRHRRDCHALGGLTDAVCLKQRCTCWWRRPNYMTAIEKIFFRVNCKQAALCFPLRLHDYQAILSEFSTLVGEKDHSGTASYRV